MSKNQNEDIFNAKIKLEFLNKEVALFRLAKDTPSIYISEHYFGGLKSKIDSIAEIQLETTKDHKRIDKSRKLILDKLQAIEKECLKKLENLSDQERKETNDAFKSLEEFEAKLIKFYSKETSERSEYSEMKHFELELNEKFNEIKKVYFANRSLIFRQEKDCLGQLICIDEYLSQKFERFFLKYFLFHLIHFLSFLFI